MISCTLHLKKNVEKYLIDKAITDAKSRKAVISQVFGTNGLAYSKSLAVFDTQSQHLSSNFASSPGQGFNRYFLKDVVPNLRSNNVADRCGWTSNNNESINAQFKHSTKWKAQQLPELIELLRNIVATQHIDAERAMFGVGDFRLQASHKKFSVQSLNEWQLLTETQRRTRMNKCFRLHSVKTTSVSKDCSLAVNCSTTASRKPGQKSRPRANRTVSINTAK
jgi:hypothetical protein